jgi:hypothetical protein
MELQIHVHDGHRAPVGFLLDEVLQLELPGQQPIERHVGDPMAALAPFIHRLARHPGRDRRIDQH